MKEMLTAVCLATVQDRAAQIAQRRSDAGLAHRHVWRKQISDTRASLCAGKYRADVVSCRRLEPMGGVSLRMSDMRTLRYATTRDTTWKRRIRGASQ